MKITLIRSRAVDPAVNKVAETLSRNGYDVQLLLWDRQNTIKSNSNEYKIRKFGPKAPYDKLVVLFYLPVWWAHEFFFLLKDSCNVIHACDLDTLIPALFVKLFRKVTILYTIYDFYANSLPDGRFNLIRNLLRKMAATIERFGIGFTYALFLVDECRYADVNGARIKKLVYIYNSPVDYFESSCPDKIDVKEINIFYAGIIHKSRGLEFLIRAVKNLDDVKLNIAGLGPDLDTIKRAALSCNNVSYFGQIPYQEVIKWSLNADILFATYDPNIPSNRLASPNKLFEAMMCSKPIIVNDNTSMTNIVRKENCGLIIPYGNVNAITNAILELKNNPSLRKKLGYNGRKAYEEKYSWSIMAKRLLDVYRELSCDESRVNNSK